MDNIQNEITKNEEKNATAKKFNKRLISIILLFSALLCTIIASCVLFFNSQKGTEDLQADAQKPQISAPELEVKTTASTFVEKPYLRTGGAGYDAYWTISSDKETATYYKPGIETTSQLSSVGVSNYTIADYCTVTASSSLIVLGAVTHAGPIVINLPSDKTYIPAGTYSVTYTLKSGYVWSDGKTGSIILSVIIPKAPLSASTVNFGTIPTQTYSKANKTPTPSIQYKSTSVEKTLTNNTDFTYSYSNNLNAGTATVSVTGKGEYTGTASTTFTIKGRDISNATIADIDDLIYNGSSKTPTTTVTDTALSKMLTAGTDFTYSYSNNVNKGTATVTIRGIGNYTGTKSKTFTILGKDVSTTTVNPINAQVYTGTAKTPLLTIKDGTRTLTLNTDYKVAYSNNVASGTACATVTGMGNYSGERVVEFNIAERNIANATFGNIETYIFNGGEKTPTPTVTDGDKTLVEGTDFEFSYANNINVGEASVIITGVGNYTGTKTAHFTIRTADLTDATVALAETEVIYDGTAKEPAIASVKIGTILLEQGRDFTLRYVNNINAGTASVILTGAGDYGGTQTVTFTVKQADVLDAEIAGVENSYAYNGSAIEPSPAVTIGDRTLLKGTDFTITYADNINLGYATVTVSGVGNYTGSKSVNFEIVRASIDAVAQVTGINESYEYTGNAIKPEPVVTFGEVTLVKGVDYAVNYTNNVLVGTATIKVTGTGSFKEEIIIEFQIDKATLEIEIQFVNYDGTRTLYTGEETPSIRAVATLGDVMIEGSVSWMEGSTTLVSGEREYSWKFIPVDTDCYKTQTGTKTLTAINPVLDAITAVWNNGESQPDIFTTTDLEDLKALITVKGTKTDGNDYGIIENYEIKGSWNYGVSDEEILPAPVQGGTYDITIIYEGKEFILQGVNYQDVSFEGLEVTHADGRQIKKNYTALNTFDVNSIKVIAKFSNGDEKIINYGNNGYAIVYQGGRDKLFVGDEKITVTYTFGGETRTEDVLGLNVSKINLNLSMLDEAVTYDGEAKTIKVTGTYSEEIVKITYSHYKRNGNAEEFMPNPADVKNAGNYTVKATFTLLGEDNELNYEAIADKSANLTILRATYGGGITFSKMTAEYDGTEQWSKFTVRNLPEGVTANYRYFEDVNCQFEIDKKDVKNAGNYGLIVTFTVGENYMPISEMRGTFEITKINPNLSPTVGGQTVAGNKVGSLFLISGDNDTEGVFILERAEEVLFEGVNRLYYTFTPADTVNFNPVSFFVDIPVESNGATGNNPAGNVNGGMTDGTLIAIVVACVAVALLVAVVALILALKGKKNGGDGDGFYDTVSEDDFNNY